MESSLGAQRIQQRRFGGDVAMFKRRVVRVSFTVNGVMDETEFDLVDASFEEMVTELFQLLNDFFAENNMKNASVVYVEEVSAYIEEAEERII